MQGERDAKFQEAATNYGVNFKKFISQVRADLQSPHLPFIYGQVNPPVEQFAFVHTVREAQAQTEQEVPCTKMILTDDLGKLDDGLHYDASGLMEMGRRFTKAFLQR